MKYATALALLCAPLHTAAAQTPHEQAGFASIEIVARSLERGQIDKLDKRGNARLHYAAAGTNTPVVEFLLAQGASVNLGNKEYGTTPLHELARTVAQDRARIRESARALLAAGADATIVDRHGEDALQAAARAGNALVAQAILDARSGSISADSMQQALQLAQEHGRYEVITVLERHGVQSEAGKATGLLNAAALGNLAMVKRLAESGAAIESSGATGETALQLAASNGHTEVLRYLLTRGARVNAQSQDGRGALHLAAANRRAEVVDVLLADGADVNLSSLAFGTPVNSAAEKEAADMVSRLIERGAVPATVHGSGEHAFGSGLARRMYAEYHRASAPAQDTQAQRRQARESLELGKQLFEQQWLEYQKLRDKERRKDMMIEAIAAGIAGGIVTVVHELQQQQVDAGRRQIAQIAALRDATSYQDYHSRYQQLMINSDTGSPYQLDLLAPASATTASVSGLDLIIGEYDRRIALTQKLLDEPDEP